MAGKAALVQEAAKTKAAETAICMLADAKAATEALLSLAGARATEASHRADVAEGNAAAALVSLSQTIDAEKAAKKMAEDALGEVARAEAAMLAAEEKAEMEVAKREEAESSLAQALLVVEGLKKEALAMVPAVGQSVGPDAPKQVPTSSHPGKKILQKDSAIALEIPPSLGEELQLDPPLLLAGSKTKVAANNKAKRLAKRLAKEKFKATPSKAPDPPKKVLTRDPPTPSPLALSEVKVPKVKIGITDAAFLEAALLRLPPGYRIDYFEFDQSLPMESWICKT